MVTKNLQTPLIVHHTAQLDSGVMSIFFHRPINFQFEAGDWMDLNFYDGNPNGGITYSLSSSPTEDMLAITFKMGISPFKKQLQAVVEGDKLFISQFGNDYGFYPKENQSSVLIAGGIGIAPFRSMLKELADSNSNSDVQLLYLQKEAPFIFAAELDEWQRQLPNVHIAYIETKLLNRKKREKLLAGMLDGGADRYFIAGPEGMVESTEHFLIDGGVSAKAIRIDSFGGY